MKKNQFKKNYALTIIAVLVFATSQAQVKIAAEGPPRPGYICRCSIAGYGCAGSAACLSRCASKCHLILSQIGSSESTLLADVCPNAVSQTNAVLVLSAKPGMLNRMHQSEWGSMKLLDAAASESNFIGIANKELETVKLYPVE